MNHGSSIGVAPENRRCWTCEHFVALTEEGSAFCIHRNEVRTSAQAAGCAFHSRAPDRPDDRPAPVSFCEAWRRVPKSIPRPPEVMALLIEDRRGRRGLQQSGAGWRNGEEHQWSRDPDRGRRYR
jgi:hypothetical protein